RGYAAGRAWLATRYPEFKPQPALTRALRGRGRRSGGGGAAPPPTRDRLLFAALDLVLALDELVGLRMSNRP
ncbi:MAG TPA: hypothetical protein VGX45_09210, partial [Solirubrobacteraceae bacterium]|nr:hypothetical protein [Solirubrobacteraceae bacterium]